MLAAVREVLGVASEVLVPEALEPASERMEPASERPIVMGILIMPRLLVIMSVMVLRQSGHVLFGVLTNHESMQSSQKACMHGNAMAAVASTSG